MRSTSAAEGKVDHLASVLLMTPLQSGADANDYNVHMNSKPPKVPSEQIKYMTERYPYLHARKNGICRAHAD